MFYNRVQIGKIRNIDYDKGVGEIVSSKGKFLFTIDDTKDDTLQQGDLVKFRAEQVQDVNKACFVNKIDRSYQHKDAPIVAGKQYTFKRSE